MRAERWVGLRVTETEHAALEAVARANQQTVAALLREAIEEVVADCQDARIFVRDNSPQA